MDGTAGTGEGVVVDAATVVLVRPHGGPDGADGANGAGGGAVECLMLRKNAGQAFGGMWVFPGGRVEPVDGDGLEGARRAAVREAEEETGLVLPVDGLVPFAHWMPPPEAPRRFATWFFLAALPDGASDVVVDGGEIGDQMWTTAPGALDRHRAGEIDLAPPTWMTLRWLSAAATVDAALATARAGEVERFVTHMADDDGVLVAMWADDAGYGARDPGLPGPRHRLRMTPGGWTYERRG
ncbi:MAG TPA: NUDIX hydrolase [Acidimicrobiales bacterium]